MEINEIIRSVKNQLEENEGELGYWGPEIANLRAFVPSSLRSSETAKKRRNELGEILNNFHKNTIGDCHLCPLGDTRKKIVFGVGNPNAPVMFIGEGPGFDEDRKGEPFVGKAGQLLDKILAAIHLDRTKVYIANIVKCHPMIDPAQPEKRGNDRPPIEEEIEKCIPFLKKQIEIIRPEIIVTLGATAMRALFRSQEGITKNRGIIRPIPLVENQKPIPVLPTYHPAALLRNPSLKRDVWEDMKKLRDILQGVIP